MNRIFLSHSEYVPKSLPPRESLIEAAMEDLGDFLLVYPFEAGRHAAQNGRNELFAIKLRLKTHRQATVEWAVKRCLESEFIVLENLPEDRGPVYDDDGNVVNENCIFDNFFLWCLPQFADWCRARDRTTDRNADRKKFHSPKPRVLELARRLELHKGTGRPEIDIAREFAKADEKPDSLMKAVRRLRNRA